MYHPIWIHLYAVEQFWHRIDLLGIIIPGIHYIFARDPTLQRLHSEAELSRAEEDSKHEEVYAQILGNVKLSKS